MLSALFVLPGLLAQSSGPPLDHANLLEALREGRSEAELAARVAATREAGGLRLDPQALVELMEAGARSPTLFRALERRLRASAPGFDLRPLFQSFRLREDQLRRLLEGGFPQELLAEWFRVEGLRYEGARAPREAGPALREAVRGQAPPPRRREGSPAWFWGPPLPGAGRAGLPLLLPAFGPGPGALWYLPGPLPQTFLYVWEPPPPKEGRAP